MVAVALDVGQGGEDLEQVRQRALDCGAVEAVVIDARDEFAEDFCLPALRANALYMDRYPLVSALSRPLIVRHLVTAARAHGATVVSHGCTGKGNDQVRFEVGVANLAPQLKVIAPVRDYAWTREKAIGYAEEKGLPIEANKKSPYSIDQNVWGRAVETGFLEDIWNAPIEEVYAYTKDPSVPRDADEVVITFERGVPIALDGEKVSMLRPSPNSTSAPAPTGSAGWIWSRTGWSASRAGRCTRPRGHRADHGPHGAGERHRRTGAGPVQARGRPAVGRTRLRRPVVLPAQAGAGQADRRGPDLGLR